METAAPGPSVPAYSSALTPDVSQPTSRIRQPLPRKSPSRHQTPNDVLLNSTSSDVISDLLASFPAINLPNPSDFPSPLPTPPPRNPARSTRHSKAPTPRMSISPSRAPPNTTHQFVFEVQHPIEDVAELPPEEDAAEPPVVRTSRPPSSFNRPSTQRTLRRTKNRYSPSPQAISSPPPERVGPSGFQSTGANSVQSGYQSPNQVTGSRRDSLDSTRSRDSFQKIFWRLTSRGKDRDIYPPSSSHSLRAAEYDSQRAGWAPSAVQTPVYRSIAPSARISEDGGENAAGVSNPRIRFQTMQSQNSLQKMRVSPSSTQNGVQLNTTEDRELPERKSPLSGEPSFSPVITQTAALAGDREKESASTTRGLESGSNIITSAGDETDVLRRIKELKAAREERRKSLNEQPSAFPPNVPSRPSPVEADIYASLQDSPPSTAVSSNQLEDDTAAVDERRVGNERLGGPDAFLLDVPRTPTTPAKPTRLINAFKQKSPIVEISKERAFIVESIASTTRSTARPSLDSPKPSHLGAMKQRPSPAASSTIPPPSPRGEHRRNRFSMSRTPVVEDSRLGIDATNASVREFLSSPRLSQQVPFPSDGRRISFSEVGDPNGYVVFCCVGMGLTRYIMAYYDELATSLKLRLITPDRPGIGDSEPCTDGAISPFNWPDDVQVICAKLGITKFSVLAHSAGVIYALATALRMSQFLRGKIHLLAPWIPPSQLVSPNITDSSNNPTGALPRSQRFLRLLPTSFLKLSNSPLTGMSRNNSPKASSGKTRKSSEATTKSSGRPSFNPQGFTSTTPRLAPKANTRPPSPRLEDIVQIPSGQDFAASMLSKNDWGSGDLKQRTRQYDAALTPAIWELATRNANPAVDLIICLERTRPIGFRYADVGSKPAQNVREGFVDVPGSQWPGYGIVIHHGSKDTRVPVENAKWLGKVMRQAEVRVLEGEGHGLMATAGVMGTVLTEIGKEWERSNWV